VQSPFFLLNQLFTPSYWGEDGFDAAIDPTSLTVAGTELIQPSDPKMGIVGRLYSQKTYMVLKIEKTPGTHGAYPELKGPDGKFAQQGRLLDSLLTRADAAAAETKARLDLAFNAAQALFRFERVKKSAEDQVKKGSLDFLKDKNFTDLPLDQQDAVKDSAAAANATKTIRSYVNFAQQLRKDAGEDQTKISAVWGKLINYIDKENWGIWCTEDKSKIWNIEWLRVLKETKEAVAQMNAMASQYDTVAVTWEALKSKCPPPPKAPPAPVPAAGASSSETPPAKTLSPKAPAPSKQPASK
jgi:hypothetical protein